MVDDEKRVMLAVMAGFLLVLGLVLGWTQYQGQQERDRRVQDLTERIVSGS